MKQSIKSKVEAAPLFLQKIYTMFEDAPSRVASWANKGSTVVIKEPEEFAKTILPQYFKHSNFSSFVRQLNFYGFRKFKKDDILIPENDATKHWWEFKHEKFLRHAPELMAQIRRKTYSESNDANSSDGASSSNDVDVLKSQVKAMQSQFDALASQIQSLTNVVTELVQSKKRTFLPVNDDDDSEYATSEDEVVDAKRIKLEDQQLPMTMPTLSKQHSLSLDHLDDFTIDEGILDPAAWLDGLDFSLPPVAALPPAVHRCTNSGPLSFLIALKPQKST
ncbi:Aste57867_10035 [Aphanomyces stellatus]|uniref:Aste57867_10035 protein n=1 Tax=Aphanomyces stellatus TaxID=120398 RepID=A0A485KPB9_9STRA|nr:hypothetical protein As57867_009996 [Aphanomyces stellatus]VFT86912.1 Aste57867_10035 [Aphanomyces stellatus]